MLSKYLQYLKNSNSSCSICFSYKVAVSYINYLFHVIKYCTAAVKKLKENILTFLHGRMLQYIDINIHTYINA